MHKIQKNTGVTYAHIEEMIKKFEKWDLITKEKKGRIKELTLTVKGRNISKKIRGLFNSIDRIDEK